MVYVSGQIRILHDPTRAAVSAGLVNLANASSHIDVVVHTEPAEWWQITAALTRLAALPVLVFVMVIEWWSRAEWAMDMALDD